MNVLLWVIVGCLAGPLMAITAWSMVVGLVAVFAGDRWERCRSCGRLGLTNAGHRHAYGCPQAHHYHLSLPHSLHLGH